MSSAIPDAFCSAISMTTTSANRLSATPLATVAPTFPAPPTIDTLRFMKLQSPSGLLGQPPEACGRFTQKLWKSLWKRVHVYNADTFISECFSELHHRRARRTTTPTRVGKATNYTVGTA